VRHDWLTHSLDQQAGLDRSRVGVKEANGHARKAKEPRTGYLPVYLPVRNHRQWPASGARRRRQEKVLPDTARKEVAYVSSKTDQVD